MSILDQQMIAVLEHVALEDRPRVMSVFLQSIGPVSEECKDAMLNLLDEVSE